MTITSIIACRRPSRTFNPTADVRPGSWMKVGAGQYMQRFQMIHQTGRDVYWFQSQTLADCKKIV